VSRDTGLGRKLQGVDAQFCIRLSGLANIFSSASNKLIVRPCIIVHIVCECLLCNDCNYTDV